MGKDSIHKITPEMLARIITSGPRYYSSGIDETAKLREGILKAEIIKRDYSTDEGKAIE